MQLSHTPQSALFRATNPTNKKINVVVEVSSINKPKWAAARGWEGEVTVLLFAPVQDCHPFGAERSKHQEANELPKEFCESQSSSSLFLKNPFLELSCQGENAVGRWSAQLGTTCLVSLWAKHFLTG